jgi:hypothetical protein
VAYRVAWRFKETRAGSAGEYCFATREEAEKGAEGAQQKNPDFEFWVEEEYWPELIGEDDWPELIGV